MKTLVIIRHAHRDKDLGREADNGLSTKGKRQARRVAKFFEKRFSKGYKKSRIAFLSSPKRRCVETLELAARKHRAKVEALRDLDEGGNLSAKVDAFVRRWRESDQDLIVICSHGDWIPVFFEKFLGLCIDLKKGAWAEVEMEGHSRKLTWLLQELP